MLSYSVATWVVRLATAYLVVGLGFGVIFAYRLVNRMDPVAAHGTGPFRLLIIPGATLLWPMLLARVVSGVRAPPMERTAHRSPAP
jgi:hypothetical protein